MSPQSADIVGAEVERRCGRARIGMDVATECGYCKCRGRKKVKKGEDWYYCRCRGREKVQKGED